MGAVLVCVASFLIAPPAASAAGPRPAFQIPFRCGERWGASSRSGHSAIDWNFGTGSDDLGKTVTAAAAGTAVAKYHYAYGYYVDVDHGGGWVTRYAHLLEGGLASGPVAQGEPIGLVGSTGSSSAPHLHWEQRANDVPQSTLTADGEVLQADGRTYTSRNCLRRDPFLSGDIDNDGADDLVARFVASDGSSTIKIVGGAGERQLRPRAGLSLTPAELPATALLALGDTNGDKHADLNGAFASDGGVLFVTFAGTAAGTFGSREVRHFGSGWPFRRLKSVQAADVDGDRIADLTARFVNGRGESVLRTIKGATSPLLARRTKKVVDATALPASASVAMGDTNGDRRADLNAVFGAADGVQLVSLYGRTDGTLSGPRTRMTTDGFGARAIKAVRVGDVNDDRVDDVVVRSVRSNGASTLRVIRGKDQRLLGRVDKTRLPLRAMPPAAYVTVGDTNRGGRADLNAAFAGGGGTRFASFYGKADGSFGDRRVRYTSDRWAFHRLC